MLKVGLTGSMAAGKSTVARMFEELGVPVFSADAAVHALYAPGEEAARKVIDRFPAARDARGGVNRAKLAEIVRRDPAALAALERIVHPFVTRMRESFFTECARRGAPYAIAEIPLLYETGADRDLDAVILVAAPEEERRRRALARPGMDAERYEWLTSRQFPQEKKRARADFVIDAADDLDETRLRVRNVHESLMRRIGRDA